MILHRRFPLNIVKRISLKQKQIVPTNAVHLSCAERKRWRFVHKIIIFGKIGSNYDWNGNINDDNENKKRKRLYIVVVTSSSNSNGMEWSRRAVSRVGILCIRTEFHQIQAAINNLLILSDVIRRRRILWTDQLRWSNVWLCARVRHSIVLRTIFRYIHAEPAVHNANMCIHNRIHTIRVVYNIHSRSDCFFLVSIVNSVEACVRWYRWEEKSNATQGKKNCVVTFAHNRVVASVHVERDSLFSFQLPAVTWLYMQQTRVASHLSYFPASTSSMPIL